MTTLYERLLNRTCHIWRSDATAVDSFGERVAVYTRIYSDVKCRRESSKATDNVPLTIGQGDQLRAQQVFFFLPTQDLHFRDRIELVEAATGPQPEDGFWEILAIDSLDTASRIHHIEVEAHRIFV